MHHRYENWGGLVDYSYLLLRRLTLRGLFFLFCFNYIRLPVRQTSRCIMIEVSVSQGICARLLYDT